MQSNVQCLRLKHFDTELKDIKVAIKTGSVLFYLSSTVVYHFQNLGVLMCKAFKTNWNLSKIKTFPVQGQQEQCWFHVICMQGILYLW